MKQTMKQNVDFIISILFTLRKKSKKRKEYRAMFYIRNDIDCLNSYRNPWNLDFHLNLM